MLAQLASFRVRLVAALAGAAVLGLIAAFLILTTVDMMQETAAYMREANGSASWVAAQARLGAGQAEFARMQGMLASDQLIVIRGGKEVFRGPPVPQGLSFVTVSASFPGGKVVFRDAETGQISLPGEELIVGGGVAILVIGVAWAASTLLTRNIREPVEQAIDVADRLAAGDLTVRMGAVRPAEFGHLARAFDEMASRLESADREQRRFLADVAHEIATPLSAVTGFALALADGSAGTLAERQEAAEVITSQADRLGGLLRDLRLLTRLDLTEAVRIEPVFVGEFLHAVRTRFAPQVRQTGVTFTASGWNGQFICDRVLLETVLDNLTSNAIRYTASGGRVKVRVRRQGKDVIFAVRDTGIGIAPEHRQRVFDRLYRTDEARDRANGGAGLGLAIAQRAALALGGRIELDSEVGKGSEFRLIVPFSRDRGGRTSQPQAGAGT